MKRTEVVIQPRMIDTVVLDDDGDTWEYGVAVGKWRCTSQPDEDPLLWDELVSEYGPLYLKERGDDRR